jgi:hypothetical protein
MHSRNKNSRNLEATWSLAPLGTWSNLVKVERASLTILLLQPLGNSQFAQTHLLQKLGLRSLFTTCSLGTLFAMCNHVLEKSRCSNLKTHLVLEPCRKCASACSRPTTMRSLWLETQSVTWHCDNYNQHEHHPQPRQQLLRCKTCLSMSWKPKPCKPKEKTQRKTMRNRSIQFEEIKNETGILDKTWHGSNETSCCTLKQA